MTASRVCVAVAFVGNLAWGQELPPPQPETALSQQELIQVAALRPFVIDSCPKAGRRYPGGCVVTAGGKNVSARVRELLSRDARVQPSEAGDFDFEDGATGAFRRRLALIVDVTSLATTSATQVSVRLAILASGLSSRECDGLVLRVGDGHWEMDHKGIRCTIS